MDNSYGNDSISQLKGAETIRLKPASILGTDQDGNQCYLEILANACDEWREQNFAKPIEIVKHADRSISVKDYGRGCPLDWNETEQKFNYELVFMTLYAGGKYKKGEVDNYEFSLGTNGLGATATQYTSKYMDVEVVRDGYKYSLHFEEGELVGEMKKEVTTEKKSFTFVRWIPDDEVFLEDDIPSEYIKDVLDKQAIVNKGLKFSFIDEIKNETCEYCYENGIADYIEKIADGKNFTDIQLLERETIGKDREDKKAYKVKMNIVYCFSNENCITEYYHNGSWLEHGGSPDKAVKLGFVGAIDKYINTTGKYLKGEKKVSFDDIKESLILISNNFSTETSYENQTKKSITNVFIKDTMTEFLKESLEVYFMENALIADNVCNQILANKRSREKADTNRSKLRKELEGHVGNAPTRPEKYVPTGSNDKTKKRLVLIEGDSALNAVKLSRDEIYDGIFPLKGKPMNCLKKTIDEIMQNDEIKAIVKLTGAGVTYKGKAIKGLPKFNLEDMQFSEIDILSDADEDGFHIRCLLIVVFYVLMTDLIKAGRLKILEAPLYRIVFKGKEYIAYDEMEKTKILEKINSKNFVETRFKGLGGLNTQLMAETVMNMENRRVKVVTMEDVAECVRVLEMFLDDDSSERKKFIGEHGHEYFDYSVYED